MNNNPTNYSVKIIHNDKPTDKKKNKDKPQSVNTIIINNHINNYNYNVSIKNIYNNEKEKCLNRKRNRVNSFEGLLNLFPDLGKECAGSCFYPKKSCDETDYMDYFNCTFKNSKNDFDEEREKDLLFFSQTQDIADAMTQLNNAEMLMIGNSLNMNNSIHNDFTFDDLMMDVKLDFKVDGIDKKVISY